MMMFKPDWWDYANFNDEGFLKGIKEDSPPEIKKQYEEYLKQEENHRKEGIKL
ncbi:hypothetical protein MKC73_19445 [[Clostridium] innocuum]|nr:hypothetical protein [[Clostridium] innocuum]